MAPIGSTYYLLQHQKHCVRREVKKRIIAQTDSSAYVRLCFHTKKDAHKLRWEHAKEFEYQGEMYDIVYKTVRGDSIYYWCWWDRAETALNQQLASLLLVAWQHSPKHKHTKASFFDFYKKLFFQDCSHFAATFFPKEKAMYPREYSVSRPNPSEKPFTPPPEAGRRFFTET